MAIASCAPKMRSKDSDSMRQRVDLSANLLDVADVAQTLFHNEVARSMANKDPRSVLAAKELIRNNAVGNVRALALGQDPYGALVDLYVWCRLAEFSCQNRRHYFPELKFDCESTYAEIRRRLDLIIARGALIKDAERAKLDEVVQHFIATHPDLINAGLVRIDDLSEYSGTRMAVLDAAPSDMLSPVEDAASELEQARLIGMQMVWLGSRLTGAAGWEAQTVVDLTLSGPEFERITHGVEEMGARLAATQDSLGKHAEAVEHLADSLATLKEEVRSLSAAREIVRETLLQVGIAAAAVLAVGWYVAHRLVRRLENRKA